MNFRNKIYEAVQNGIMNALSTDIQDQDIDFNTADINNEYKYEITIDELLDMVSKSPNDMFCYNTGNVIRFILNGGTEISLHEYDKTKDTVQFIKLMNPSVYNGSVIIHKDLFMNLDGLAWQYKNPIKTFVRSDIIPVRGNSDKIYNDFNGYLHTYFNKNIQYASDIPGNMFTDNNPAFQYIDNINIPGYRAYMPATGELLLLFKYLPLINYLLKTIGGTQIPKGSSNVWQTSTEESSQSKICCHAKLPAYMHVPYESCFKRNEKNKLLPFFKKI